MITILENIVKLDYISENYIRYLIRMIFYPFSVLNYERMGQWSKIRYWKYKKTKYKNYFDYLK